MTDTPSEAMEWHDFRLDVDDVPLEAEPKGRSVSLVICMSLQEHLLPCHRFITCIACMHACLLCVDLCCLTEIMAG